MSMVFENEKFSIVFPVPFIINRYVAGTVMNLTERERESKKEERIEDKETLILLISLIRVCK